MPEMSAPAPSADAAASAAAPPDAARLEWLWQEYEKQMAEQKQYQDEGMDIYPTPGFVVKSALLSAPSRPSPQFPSLPAMAPGQRIKLFLNLCSDAAIALPSMQQDAEGNEQLRVPVSAGPVTLALDKDGVTPVLVSDMVLNPASIARAQSERDFRSFIAGFTLQKVQEKYHCVVDQGEQTIKFPKLKYKGPLPPPSQHIRRPAGAHIEPEAPVGRGQTEEQNRAYEDAMEERRKAAQLARIEALRAMEERESGIIMGGSKSAAGAKAAATPVFTSSEAAQAAEEAEAAMSPVDRVIAKKEGAKIEVISDEPAAPATAAASARQRAQQQQAAAKSASSAASSIAAAPSPAIPVPAASSSAAATAAAAAAPVDPRLPSHVISYLKSNGSSVPASEWDVDLTAPAAGADEDDDTSLTLPAAIQVLISLPLAASAQEIDVDITKDGVDLASRPEHSHQYRLHMLFPFLLDDERASCKFAKKTRTLTLTLPVTAKKILPADEDLIIDEPATAATSTVPAVDWQAKLGLTNTVMFQLVSEA